MAGVLTLVRGPAGAGKSQRVRSMLEDGELDAEADFTRLHVAISGVERDAEGRYPTRRDDDPLVALAAYLKAVVVREGLRRGFRLAVTTSDSDQAEVERYRAMATEAGAAFDALTVDPGREVAAARLADPETDELGQECAAALRRWYRR